MLGIHGYESHVSGGPRITMAKGGVPRENVAIDIVDGVEKIDVSGVAIDESLGAGLLRIEPLSRESRAGVRDCFSLLVSIRESSSFPSDQGRRGTG